MIAKQPTLIEDLHALYGFNSPVYRMPAYERLRAFLESPAVVALSDPTLRAAAEVVIAKLPELLERRQRVLSPPIGSVLSEQLGYFDDWCHQLFDEAAQAAKGEGA